MVQSTTKKWDFGAPSWAGGNTAILANVQAGSTLVLCVWGYQSSASPQRVFSDPIDSLGQPIQIAVDAGHDPRVPVQSKAWVLHNAQPGSHAWTNLPNFIGGDGCLFFMEFLRPGAPSSATVGGAANTISALAAPWFTSGSVTMSAGANVGDLLVAFSFEEEFITGQPFTPYTDPPAGWTSVGVQNESVNNIAGEVCWRIAPDTARQTVGWSWTITGKQDPTVFKGIVFGVV